MPVWHGKILTFMLNGMYLGWICINTFFQISIPDNGVIFPRSLPKFVSHIHKLIGKIITLIMSYLVAETKIARGTLLLRRDNVPTNATIGDVIQCAKLTRSLIRMFVCGGKRNAKSQLFCCRSHCGNKQEWIN